MKKWIILAVVLIAVLVLAAVAYPFLKGMYLVFFAPDFAWHEPEPAADILLTDETGTAHALSEFYGKPIVMNFWATWCQPCEAELPGFEAAAADYGETVTFLMVNVEGEDAAADSVAAYVREHGFTFPLYLDAEDAAWERYSLLGIPTTVFIDPDGGVVGTWFGSMTEAELRELLDAFGGMTNEE